MDEASQYKLHRIEGGYSVRNKAQNRDIKTFLGKVARARALTLKAELEAKAKEGAQ